jgi:hypothetical protein
VPTLDDLRIQDEKDLEEKLAELDERHRAALKAAIKKYGRVQDIPEIIWIQIQREIEDTELAAIAVLILAADTWTANEIQQQGVPRRRLANRNEAQADALRQLLSTVPDTVRTVRNRLQRRIEDQLAGPSGDVGELTDEGLDTALDHVFTPERRATIAADQVTTAYTTGQRTAGERIVGDGVRNADGQRVTLELIWRTERDNLVCHRCSPLEGTTEEHWGKVFPDGPGPTAHPNCRCSLQPQVIVDDGVRESVEADPLQEWEEEIQALTPIQEPIDLSPILEAIDNIPLPAPPADNTEQILEAIRGIEFPQPPTIEIPEPIDNTQQILEAVQAIKLPEIKLPEPPPDNTDRILEAIHAIPQPEPPTDNTPAILEAIKAQPDIDALIAATHVEPYDDTATRELLTAILAKLSEPPPPPKPWHFHVERDADQLITSIKAVKE